MTYDDSKATSALPVTSPSAGLGESDSASAATGSALDEDSALARLKHSDLSLDLIEKIAKSSVTNKSRKLKLAIVRHPKSPRYVSLALIRKLFTFDLMQVALTPAVAGDLKMAAEAALIHRLETLSAGERLSLAHRASGRVAGELLLAAEAGIIQGALENPRLTEVLVTKALLRREASPALIQLVCTHSKWSLRREVRIALLRSEHTPPEQAIEFARSLSNDVVREILENSRLPETIRHCLSQGLEP